MRSIKESQVNNSLFRLYTVSECYCPVECLKECLLSPTGQKLHQHEVVGELLLVKQHGTGEAHGADEECQPKLGDG